ncbi:MAG: type II secretion system F family protein [Lachnospiraceae bacterium]|nr:type II secretion system F family protein [Lachnospiraceae bacterium]
MAGKAEKIYSGRELAAFCMQISLLLKAAVPLYEGLAIMAEDAVTEQEKEMLKTLSLDVELGDPFYTAMEKAGCFPFYVVRMAKLGQQTGTLDQIMESLSVYYEKEYIMMKNIRNAITYPVMMAAMLLVVLFVLFTKVMPVFEQVYIQLGVQLSPVSVAASRFGGIFSGIALLLFVLVALVALAAAIASGAGHAFSWVERLKDWVKRRNKTMLAVAGRRFTSVLALTLKSGMELEKGMELAQELVDNSRIAATIGECAAQLQEGTSYFEAMKQTGLFSGFHVQMIKVGTRSGRLDEVMNEISEDYEQQADASIDNMIARLEPTMVAVLAIVVGLILLSVMLPLAGVLAGIG